MIVHVLGFSQHHDASFLESLTLLGTADGSYSYVAPSDGDAALERRLTELLEATTGLVRVLMPLLPAAVVVAIALLLHIFL